MLERSATGPAAIRSGAASRAAHAAGVSGRLRTIFVEPQGDIGCVPTRSGKFARWARQGVLLLNAVPTVEAGPAATRGGKGLTGPVLNAFVRDARPPVVPLWGAYAQAKQTLLDAANGAHLARIGNHRRPLPGLRPSRPLLGGRHSALTNAFPASGRRGAIDCCGSGTARR